MTTNALDAPHAAGFDWGSAAAPVYPLSHGHAARSRGNGAAVILGLGGLVLGLVLGGIGGYLLGQRDSANLPAPAAQNTPNEPRLPTQPTTAQPSKSATLAALPATAPAAELSVVAGSGLGVELDLPKSGQLAPEKPSQRPPLTQVPAPSAPPSSGRGLSQDQYATLQELIRPTADESYWSQIPWLINMWDAQQKAAAEGKPIVVWSMAGEPLGTC
jgi:hypothetical protein